MGKIDFQVIATTIMGAVNESVQGFLKVRADKEPQISTRTLYAADKMDLSTYGEFIDGSYISVIYFHPHERDKGSKNYCGMLILYVSTSLMNYLVKVFGYKSAAEAGEDMCADAAAELCNNVAGIFKKELSTLGYPELEISTPFKSKGFFMGLDFPKGQRTYHRVTAYVWGQSMHMDIILTI